MKGIYRFCRASAVTLVISLKGEICERKKFDSACADRARHSRARVQRATDSDACPHADDYASATATHCHQTTAHANRAANLDAGAGVADSGIAERDADAHTRPRRRDAQTFGNADDCASRKSEREHRVSSERRRRPANVRH